MKLILFATLALVIPITLLLTPTQAQNKASPLFVSQQAHDNYLKFVPKGIFSSDELARIVFYDKTTVPQANQDWASASGLVGWYQISANISANRSEPFGNPNREFPWLTGGLDNSTNGSDFKAYIPPVGKDTLPYPIKGKWEVLPHVNGISNGEYTSIWDQFSSMTAYYPIGAKLIEFLLIQDPEGYHHTFEVRVMVKVKEGNLWDVQNNWEFKVYRAVRDSGDLIRIVRRDGFSSTPSHPVGQYFTALTRHYSTGKFSTETLKNKHPVKVFESSAVVDPLPPAGKDVLKLVHGRRFQEVTDVPWLETADGGKAFAGRGGVFPSGYQGNHFHSGNCASCHATVLKHAGDLQLSRDWYLRVRGVDGIFSLPMVDPSSVDRQDARTHGRPMLWNQKLVKAGLLVGDTKPSR